MLKTAPKRIAIIGLPGSGKSTFGAKLSKTLNLPLHHLDKHTFLPGGVKRNAAEFLAIQKALVDQDEWIIEGCSITTLDTRYSRADVVIYFRLPRLLCIWRALKRRFKSDKTLSDTPDGCSKVFNAELLEYIWNFEKEKGAKIEALKQKYPHVEFRVVRSAQEAQKQLQGLTNS
jgi:adenylate kinase family enzyme